LLACFPPEVVLERPTTDLDLLLAEAAFVWLERQLVAAPSLLAVPACVVPLLVAEVVHFAVAVVALPLLDDSAAVPLVVKVFVVAVPVELVVAVVLEPAVREEVLFVVAVECQDSFVVVQVRESEAEAPYVGVVTDSHVYLASKTVASSVVHAIGQGELAVKLSAASACCASCLPGVVVVAVAVAVAVAALAAPACAACPPTLVEQRACLPAYPDAAAFEPDIAASSAASFGSAYPSSCAVVAGLPS